MEQITSFGEPVKILMVEDDDSHAELAMINFRKTRLLNSIIRLRDGEEALNYLLNRKPYDDAGTHARPDLVLLDLRMPKVDGLEVLAEMRNHDSLKRMPVVILTNSDAESDITVANELGVDGYLTKPVDFEKFLKVMHTLGYYWLALNRFSEDQ